MRQAVVLAPPRDAREIGRGSPSRAADRAARAADEALLSVLSDPATAVALRIHLERIRGT
jgi:hypothetical protein